MKRFSNLAITSSFFVRVASVIVPDANKFSLEALAANGVPPWIEPVEGSRVGE